MTLTTTQIEQLISATRQTAKTEILPWYRRLDDSEIDTKAHAQDLVTKADKASERVLTALAAEILPGAVVVGETLDRAFWRIEELETLARVYILSLQIGTPHILSDAEMDEVVTAFASYGPVDPDKA